MLFFSNIPLHGAIDTQWLLPSGTAQEVAETVRETMRILGKDGGYILKAFKPPKQVPRFLAE